MSVKVIHRSAQTYLDNGSWSTLLGDDESFAYNSQTWLKVFTAFGQQGRPLWKNSSKLIH